MGSWTSFRIDGYELSSTKSYADPETLSLFREADKHVQLFHLAPFDDRDLEWTSSWIPLSVADAAIRVGEDGFAFVTLPDGAEWELAVGDGPAAPPGLDAELDVEQPFAGHAYIASAADVRDRLDAMGFTRTAAAEVLDAFVAKRLDELRQEIFAFDDYGRMVVEERRTLESLTFDAWLEAFAWIRDRGAYKVTRASLADAPTGYPKGYAIPADEAPPIVKYVLEGTGNHTLGFPWDDVRFLYRAALEACPPAAEVMLDLTEVTGAGWYTDRQAVVDESRAARAATYPANAPILVLTEGKTDQRALQGALRVLYPHLQDLYAFMDFEATRVKGGAGAIAAMVKAFAAAGVANRVVALFDNDAAGHNALRELQEVRLPANVRALAYPDLPLGRAYPTVGPVGEQVADVNGSAAGLELYFGEDVLRDEDGALAPVQWTSMEWGVRRYQGELRDKAEVQKRFAAKLAAAEEDAGVIADQDWSGMRAILDALRRAFA